VQDASGDSGTDAWASAVAGERDAGLASGTGTGTGMAAGTATGSDEGEPGEPPADAPLSASERALLEQLGRHSEPVVQAVEDQPYPSGGGRPDGPSRAPDPLDPTFLAPPT
jgi:hypothetical protein